MFGSRHAVVVNRRVVMALVCDRWVCDMKVPNERRIFGGEPINV